MAELRSFIFLDQLQPQTLSYLGTWILGRLPAPMSPQVIESRQARHRGSDRHCLKQTEVRRAFLWLNGSGYLEFPSQ
jgi:hypothetical protein